MLLPMHDGRWFRVHERKTAEKMTVGVHVDVTELVQKERQLAHANQLLATLSTTDGLTGLHNRRSFDDSLARVAALRAPAAAAGPAAGGYRPLQALQRPLRPPGRRRLPQARGPAAARRRAAPAMVARYGGEEFVILLPGSDEEAAREVAQRCLERVRTDHIRTWPRPPARG
jgi:predicted signal transduction protein with EAL and GGDEF domain